MIQLRKSGTRSKKHKAGTWYAAHRERAILWQRRYDQEHKKKYDPEYYRKHKRKIRAKTMRYYWKNHAACLDRQKKWREKNRLKGRS